MKTIQKLFRWAIFLIFWILVTLAGSIVALVLFRWSSIDIQVITTLKSWIGIEESPISIFILTASGILGLADGIILGLFQWIALRRILRGALWWVPTTALGTAFASMAFWLIVSYLLGSDITLGEPIDSIFPLGLMDAILVGIFVGFFQWIVLRANVRGHGWWILISLAAGISTWFVRWFVNIGVAFVVYGMVTGFVLAIMLVDREIRLRRQAEAASAFLGSRLGNTGSDRPAKERIEARPNPPDSST